MDYYCKNEPGDALTVSQIDEINTNTLAIIRANNPDRLAVYSGIGFTTLGNFLDAAIPNDDFLIGNYHNYGPWEFAGMCTRGWGTQADWDALEATYSETKAWADQNNIPVTVNEFGAAHYDFQNPENICDPADRLEYLRAHSLLSRQYGVAATYWDDAGSFATYNRGTGTFGPEKDILVNPTP